MFELLNIHIQNYPHLKENILESKILADGLSIKATYNTIEIHIIVTLSSNTYTIDIFKLDDGSHFSDTGLYNYIDSTLRMLIVSRLKESETQPLWDYIRNSKDSTLCNSLIEAKNGNKILYERQYKSIDLFSTKFSTSSTSILGNFLIDHIKITMSIGISEIVKTDMYEIATSFGVLFSIIMVSEHRQVYMYNYFVSKHNDKYHIKIGLNNNDRIVVVSEPNKY